METKFGFTKYSIGEFENWFAGVSIARTVKNVQQHHTWLPNYSNFTGNNHFQMQRAMKNHHVSANGWSDIGQHFSIFPDGTILTGRPLNRSPACIFKQNSKAICFESIGNFDVGHDSMLPSQKDAIVRATAAIISRISTIKPDDTGIVYHHWFDLNTGERKNGAGTSKSCPGTGFFGGNKVTDFNANFLPLVNAALTGAVAPTPAVATVATGFVCVSADFLNIREAPTSAAPKTDDLGPAEMGSILRIYAKQNGWLKVSNSKDHWVYGKYTYPVKLGTINTDDSKCRVGPGTSFEIIDAFNKGEDVFVHEIVDGWCRVDSEAWVHSSLVLV